MAYNQEAELYWNNLLNRFSCTPDTIRTIQFDFSSDPDYQCAIQLSTEEQRAEYMRMDTNADIDLFNWQQDYERYKNEQ